MLQISTLHLITVSPSFSSSSLSFPSMMPVQMPSSGSVSLQTPPFLHPVRGALRAYDTLMLPSYSWHFYMTTCFLFTVDVLAVFFSYQYRLTVTVLRIPLLDTPTPADAAMLQVTDCASANLLTVWTIEATSRTRGCRISWSHFLLTSLIKACPFERGNMVCICT